MLGRLHNSIVRLTGTFRTAGRARCLSETGGSEPIPKMDHRHMGPKGAGDQPYAKPPPKQDGPPPGGFGNVRFQRHSTTVPNVPTAVILGGAAFAMIYGFYQIGETNKETRARKKEKKTARENLGAFLQVLAMVYVFAAMIRVVLGHYGRIYSFISNQYL